MERARRADGRGQEPCAPGAGLIAATTREPGPPTGAGPPWCRPRWPVVRWWRPCWPCGVTWCIWSRSCRGRSSWPVVDIEPECSDATEWLRDPDGGRWPDDAAPFEFLARCEGRREGDTAQDAPRVDQDGSLHLTFLVHGVRHALANPGVEGVFDTLRDGDRVNFLPQPDNPVDHFAIHVCSGDLPVGWVPRLLCPAVHDAIAAGPCGSRDGPRPPAAWRNSTARRTGISSPTLRGCRTA